MRSQLIAALTMSLCASLRLAAATAEPPMTNVSTFSIVAIDPATGEMGVAVASRYFSVGSVVPWGMAGVGAVATQANVNVGYGQQALDLLRKGLSASQVKDELLNHDTFPGKDGRQFAIVDAKGNIAAYTGPNAPHWAGDRQGKTWSAQGNILVGPQVPKAMGEAYEATHGEFAERLYAALKAGDAAGGDARGKQSASMLIVQKGGGRNTNNDRPVYINVDDSPAPFEELRRLLNLNLAYLYEDRTGKALEQGNVDRAKELATNALHYAPDKPDLLILLGMVDYVSGDKQAAMAEMQKAKAIDPKFREEVESLANFIPRFKPILSDGDFTGKLFSEK
jgi:uncharacterized Ntn-hydrolase superfamily protein